jgi:hypothetical protein
MWKQAKITREHNHRMVIEPSVLILGSKYDFSCDYVTVRLLQSGTKYLRLNSEDIELHRFVLDPLARELFCTVDNTSYRIANDTLRSVWYRRAVYPRDYGSCVPVDISEQIARIQWAAFMRGMMIFNSAKWMNHPTATYSAEQKIVQLATANDLGFAIPRTIISNDSASAATVAIQEIVLKGIDTVLAYRDNKEFFAFVETLQTSALAALDLHAIPVTIQEAIEPKTDLRVTVVENQVFAAEITADKRGIGGDWRKNKKDLAYTKCTLPRHIERLCIDLTARFGLTFGAIDLARHGDEYWFLEINPTGEWAWLVDSANLPIDEAIANALIR